MGYIRHIFFITSQKLLKFSLNIFLETISSWKETILFVFVVQQLKQLILDVVAIIEQAEFL